MDAASPIFAALGVSGFDVLNDLANWLDGDCEPTAGAEMSGWVDQVLRAATGAAGREG
jgi:hypothetical protein